MRVTVTQQGWVAGPLEEASRDLPFLETHEGGIACKTGVAPAGFADFPEDVLTRATGMDTRSDFDIRPAQPLHSLL